MKKLSGTIAIFALLSGLTACAPVTSNTQRSTLYGSGIGAGIGALAGQAIGRDTEATLIGAGIGAALGGLAGNRIGYYMDHQEQALRQALADTRAASVQREQDVLTATFRSKVLFDHDSAILKPGGYDELDRVAQVLNKYPGTHIRIEGHTDARGPETYNLQLSERRAQTVKQALVQRGVDSSRVTVIGYGESRLIASNHDANRRVAIVIEPTRQAYGFANQF